MSLETKRIVLLLLGLFVGLALLLRALHTTKRAGPSGCMAECPSPPAGCGRTTVDPGSCSDSACSKPAPVCHYVAIDAGAVCPPTLVGRCIAP